MLKSFFVVMSLFLSINSFANFAEVTCGAEKDALKAAEEKCAGLTDKKEKKACKKEMKKAKKELKKCEKKIKAENKKNKKKVEKNVKAMEASETPGKALCKRLGAIYDESKNDCKINPDCENTEDAMTFVEVPLLVKKCYVANEDRVKCEEAKKKWNEDTGKCE